MIVVLGFLLFAAVASAPQDDMRITTVTNAQLRAAPTTQAEPLRQLALGTELSVLETGTSTGEAWHRVRTSDGREGWVAGQLTTSFDPGHRGQAVEAILNTRLPADPQDDRPAGESFSSRVQIVALVERTLLASVDREDQARLSWYLLRAARHAMAAIPVRQNHESPYREWLAGHDLMAQEFEIAGTWIVAYDFAQRVHEQFRDTTAVDDIAWFLVGNGVIGECEGDMTCFVAFVNRLPGQYLRLHPTGRHVDSAMDGVAESLNGYLDHLLEYPKVLAEFDPVTRCGELQASLDPLRRAVAAANGSRRTVALAAIDRVARLCKMPDAAR